MMVKSVIVQPQKNPPKLSLAWLGYLTRENYEQRIRNFTLSMQSLSSFNSDEVEIIIVDNSEHDNDMTVKLRDIFLPKAQIFKAANEWCDVAVHYVSYFCGKSNLIGYSYDDFVFTDHSFVTPLRNFMDFNTDAWCCRIAKYEHNNDYYDANITPKDVNPEAVRKNNTQLNKSFQAVGPYRMSDNKFYTGTSEHSFYECNWRPTSRPTVWIPKMFAKIADFSETVPTLQQFEKLMYDRCDEAGNQWNSAFMDKGACFTFPQSTSTRIQNGLGITKKSPVVNIKELDKAVNDVSRWI